MNKFTDIKKIKIPIIQRDYVQARKNDEKAHEIIKKFLDDLFDKLRKNENFHLDFIYGYRDKNWFIPIDGQQRLTTLYLLYYYFAKKENKEIENILTYETRTSSREFLDFLNNLDLNFEEKISLQIKRNKYFNPYWENDPTVYSMLKVLDKIDERAKNFNITYDDLKDITFEIFEMDDFGEIQAEELYRKMNSRGKSLTPFENFKSIFEKIAFSISKEKYKEIAEKFERNWINHFWDGTNVKKVDEYIMNFIYYITEMRIYDTKYDIKNKNIKSFIFLEKFYSIRENFDFLEKVFDSLKAIKNLSTKIENEFVFFDNDKKVNLFEEVINNKINLIHKTLFYLLILSLNEEYILDLLRISRNVLHRQRKLGTGKLIYAQTVDVEYIMELIPSFKKLINENNPYDNLKNLKDKKFIHEKEKLKYFDKKEKLFELEDYRYIKGDLRLLLSVCEFDDLYKFIIFEDKIFENENLNTTLRAMLSVGDYSIWRGSVKRGSKWFFGEKGYMEILLTDNTETRKNENVYKKFFEKLQIKNSNEIVEEFINNYQNKEKDWFYYFVKYPVILSNKYGLKNLFGFMKYDDRKKDWNYFAIEKLERESKITHKHINVYLLALLEELNEKVDFSKLKFDEDYGYTLKYGKNIKLDLNWEEIIYKGSRYKVFDKDFIEEIKNETGI